MPVPFGRHTPRCDPEGPGGDQERSTRACKRVGEGLDGAAIGIGRALEVPREREVVHEREVDQGRRLR